MFCYNRADGGRVHCDIYTLIQYVQYTKNFGREEIVLEYKA